MPRTNAEADRIQRRNRLVYHPTIIFKQYTKIESTSSRQSRGREEESSEAGAELQGVGTMAQANDRRGGEDNHGDDIESVEGKRLISLRFVTQKSRIKSK